jgi:peroxiredoxin
VLDAGRIAPEFALKDITGERRHLRDYLKQGAVLTVFFKISCPTCQLTLPFLDRLQGAVRVIGISQDDAESTKEFLDYFRIGFPVLIDPAKESYAVSNAYRITNVPSMFLIGQDGRISWALHGFHKSELASLAEGWGVQLFRADEKVPLMKPG